MFVNKLLFGEYFKIKGNKKILNNPQGLKYSQHLSLITVINNFTINQITSVILLFADIAVQS